MTDPSSAIPTRRATIMISSSSISTTPSALVRLPTELLDLVLAEIGEVADDGDRNGYHIKLQTFHALTLTSKSLQTAATPWLYSEFRSEGHEHRIQPYLRTMCRNHALAGHVRSVSMAEYITRNPQPPDAAEMALFTRQVATLQSSPTWRQLGKAVGYGCYTAELVLILTLTTQVRYLRIATDDTRRLRSSRYATRECNKCPIMRTCLEIIFGSAHTNTSYRRLEHMVLFDTRNHLCDADVTHKIVSHLLSLPSLKILKCSGLGFTRDPTSYLSDAAPRSSNIEVLSLGIGNLKSVDVVQILGWAETLRDCEIHWSALYYEIRLPTDIAGLDDVDVDEDEAGGMHTDMYFRCDFDVATAALLTALTRHANSLERLIIVDLQQHGLAFRGQHPFHSLQQLHRLRELQINDQLLIRGGTWQNVSLATMLPPRLRKLVIYSIALELSDLGKILAACGDYRAPDLEDLRITFATDDADREEYFVLFDGSSSSGTRAWFLGSDTYEDGARAVFSCWERPMWPLLAALGADVRRSGLQRLFDLQCAGTEEPKEQLGLVMTAPGTDPGVDDGKDEVVAALQDMVLGEQWAELVNSHIYEPEPGI
ncbi:hypothetical protein LTR36_006398 [Oleoguttula mirabilis]|uniref:F-box domain-containing protein n=1 Tax=Oleoguttula mirabilis TaxID=1507867 RepID=A0AAV9JUR1_9PEZI|nr:hypothetical protein LTR36_006398 [Oleoguttula mirabilis]